MNRNWCVVAYVLPALLAIMLMAGCELGGGGGGSSAGTSAIAGNVVSFQTVGVSKRAVTIQHGSLFAQFLQVLSDLAVPSATAAPSQAMGGPGGITVSLNGPDDVSTTTANDGSFSFTGLEAGAYELSFEFNGQVVTYRGSSGQVATISVGTNQTAELVNIDISGGKVNIGNVRVLPNH